MYRTILFSILCTAICAQNKFNFITSKDPFKSRYFIENKGQFKQLPNGEEVLFTYQRNGENVYFTSKGVAYLFEKHYPLSEEESEKAEKGEKVKIKAPVIEWVYSNWVNSNPNIEIESGEKSSHYYTYGEEKYNSRGCKKITYKNVYKNVDVEYLLPEENESGLKYNIILHPGADLSNVKLSYQGDVKHLKKGKGGSLVVKTKFSGFKELLPSTYYKENGNTLSTSFEVEDNLATFKILGGYNHSKTVIIDPFVTLLAPPFTGNSNGYDVDYDNAGNVFVFGDSNANVPTKVAKYSAAGAVQWLFNGVLVAPVWVSGGTPASNISQIGNFVVDKALGKVYMAQGYNLNGAQIIRLNASGNYDNLMSSVNSLFREIWDLSWQCNGTVRVYGGTISSDLSAGVLNTTTGNLSLTSFTPGGSISFNQDIVNYAIDDMGQIFIYYNSLASGVIDNKIALVNSSFNGLSWISASGFTTLLEAHNKNAYLGQPVNSSAISTSNGYNCLAVNANYLFCYDGLTIRAYNKITGAIINSVPVPNATVLRQGGIAVDDCNNVYVGGNGSILCYNFNGTSFSLLPQIPVNTPATMKYVMDIKLDKAAKLLYVSGTNFAAVMNAIHTATCSPTTLSVSVTPTCSSGTGQAVATVTDNLASPQYTYVWVSGTGTVNTTIGTSLTNTVTGLASGSYTLFVYTNSCNSASTFSTNTTFSINCIPPCSVTASFLSECKNGPYSFSLSATGTSFTPLPSYTWQGPGAYSSNLQNPVYSGSPGTFTVVASNGLCTASAQITPTFQTIVASATSTNINCFDGSDGKIELNLTGGTGPYNVSWNTSPVQNGTFVSSVSVGVYTCQVSDSKNCVTTVSVQIFQPPPLTLSLSPNAVDICTGYTTQISANAFGGSPPYSYIWSGGATTPIISFVEQSATTKTLLVNVTDANGCVKTQTIQVSATPKPTLTVNDYTVCHGQSITLNVSGADQYKWEPYQWINASSGASVLCSPLSSITYTVKGFKSNCTDYKMVNVKVSSLPYVTAGKDTIFNIDDFKSISASGSGVLKWIDGEGIKCVDCPTTEITTTKSGYYTIEATNEFGCKSTDVVYIEITKEYAVYVPNSFTPNSDNKNDIFYVHGFGLKDITIDVYNRWGEKLFTSNDIKTGWNGYYKGELCKTDVYVYKLRYKTPNGIINYKTGHINLIKSEE